MLKYLIVGLVFLFSCSNMLDDFDNGFGNTDDSIRGFFRINNNATFAYSYKTTLNINVQNATEMRFSNDNLTWSEWEPFADVKNGWLLPLGNGTRRVYGEFRNEMEEVFTANDEIYFQEKIWASIPFGMVDDGYGTSVAVSEDGSTIVVGAPFDDRDRDFNAPDGNTDNQGAVYIYTWEDNEWREYRLKALSLGFEGDNFGHCVAVSGNGSRIVAGAPMADQNHSINDNLGAVYIFDYNSSLGKWEDEVYMGNPSSEFGYSVAISSDGNRVVIGAPGDGGGVVYVADYNGSSWSSLTALDPGLAIGDEFGNSVSISGDGSVIAAGATMVSSYSIGSVKVYSGSGWSTQSTLNLSSPDGQEYFGCSVALNNNGYICAIGAKGRELRQGSAYLYEILPSPSMINEIYYSSGNAGDYFGNAVSLSSDGLTAIAGAYQFDANWLNQGSAFMFNYNGTAYYLSTCKQITSPDGQVDDRFGFSISSAINGTSSILVVGASKASVDVNRQGAVYIFRNP